MRSRSADSIMARADLPSAQKKAGFMYVSFPLTFDESSCIRGGPYMHPQIHKGTPKGVMVGLRNISHQPERTTTVPEMLARYRAVKRKLLELRRDAGSQSLFKASVFHDLLIVATLVEREKSSKTEANPALRLPSSTRVPGLRRSSFLVGESQKSDHMRAIPLGPRIGGCLESGRNAEGIGRCAGEALFVAPV